MFSLIVAIFAVVLVAVLAIASIMYLSKPGEGSMSAASAAKYLQEGAQIMGALEIYKVKNLGELPRGTNEEIKNELVESSYLKSWPEDKWAFTSEYVVRNEVSETVCLIINQKLGVDRIPQCSEEDYKSRPVCCTNDDDSGAGSTDTSSAG